MPGTRALLLGIAGLLVVLIVLVAVLLLRQPQQVAQQATQEIPSAESTQPKEDTQPKESTVQDTFSGRGSDSIWIDFNRPVVITAAYSYTDEEATPGHFSITLLDDQGKQLDLIVNTVGSTQGAKAVSIPRAGRFYFNVKADKGSWNINFT